MKINFTYDKKQNRVLNGLGNSCSKTYQQPTIQYTIEAIEMIGGVRETAQRMRIPVQSVYSWFTLEWGVSPNKAIELSILTDEKILPQDLRPDVFDYDFIEGDIKSR